jgi:8-oxo-dGTP diphosphatase
VAPYADLADLEVEVTDALSEEDATPDSVAEQVQRLLARREPTVLCTHRPVLPWVFEALGLEERKLAPGGMVVAHHRRGRIVATEQH